MSFARIRNWGRTRFSIGAQQTRPYENRNRSLLFSSRFRPVYLAGLLGYTFNKLFNQMLTRNRPHSGGDRTGAQTFFRVTSLSVLQKPALISNMTIPTIFWCVRKIVSVIDGKEDAAAQNTVKRFTSVLESHYRETILRRNPK
jgi:hypothetical protein